MKTLLETEKSTGNQHFLFLAQCPLHRHRQISLLTHYQTLILDSSKLKAFADNNFRFDENGRKLSKQVENTAGKGEIARYEQFLLYPQCFQKACFPEASKGVIVWEWVKQHLTFSQTTNFGLFQTERVCT